MNIKSLREQCDHCKHFTGIGADENGNRMPLAAQRRGRCRAMVDYDDVLKPLVKGGLALPCFHPEPHEKTADGIWPTCEKRQFKTPEELDAEEAEHNKWVAESIARVTVVRPAILKHAGVTGKKPATDKAGEFACPVCKTGTLRYSVSSYNGHIHCACSTEGCVQWME